MQIDSDSNDLTPLMDTADAGGDEGEQQATEGGADEQVETPEKGEEQPAEGGAEEQAEGEEGGDKKEGEEEKPAGAPEEYADFVAPEGVELDDTFVSSFKEMAKADNLSQEAAQKYVDLATKLTAERDEAFINQIVETRKGWRDAAQSDEEYGGAEFKQNLGIAVKARDQFGTPALKALLDESGLGDHPEVIRLFHRVGKATSEHDFVNPGISRADKPFYDHPSSGKKA